MIIALDLEGVLISNAVSQIPRSGLADFLWGCRELGSVVAYTSVPEKVFRRIALEMARRDEAPEWFEMVVYVRWSGPHKLLSRVPGADHERTVLVDDSPEVVHPADLADWIRVPSFEPPYGPDRVLESVLDDLRTRARGEPLPSRLPVRHRTMEQWPEVTVDLLRWSDALQRRIDVPAEALWLMACLAHEVEVCVPPDAMTPELSAWLYRVEELVAQIVGVVSWEDAVRVLLVPQRGRSSLTAWIESGASPPWLRQALEDAWGQ